MARKSKKLIARKKRTTVKRHKAMHKKTVVEDQPQTQETPTQLPQMPVVESGFPPPSIQAFPQPQPIQPQPQPITPHLNNSTQQPPSQDAKLAVVPQQSRQSPVNTSSTISNSNEINNLPSQEFAPEKKSKLWLFVIVGFVFLVGGSGALLYFREKAVKQDPKEEKVAPTPTAGKLSPIQSPVTPTVSSSSKSANLKVDYLQYAIRVLNGSGIRGEASKLKDFLEEEKFVVKDIDNADSSDYEKTVIQAKKEVPSAFLSTLKSVLEKTYLLDANKELEDSEEVDIVIIIGSGKQP